MADEKTGLIAGFKEFISRGNAIDLAVGVVIGGAFGAIVKALVDKVLNPLVAGIVGKPNFDDVLSFHIGTANVQPGAVLTQIVNFLLIAAAIYFCVVVPINRMNRIAKEKKEALAARRRAGGETTAEEQASMTPEEQQTQLLEQIRDLLVAQNGPRA